MGELRMKNISFKLVRTKKGMRQIDIANKTGLSTSLISLYENNLKTPSPVHAQMINKILEENVFVESKNDDQ